MRSKPQLLAWLLCDGVHMDPATGKHTILGVFSNIRGRQFPFAHPHMVWFLALTDVAEGAHRLRISCGRDVTAARPLIERDFHSPGPLQRINLINEIRNLTFETPGNYSIIVEVDDDILLVTTLNIVQ